MSRNPIVRKSIFLFSYVLGLAICSPSIAQNRPFEGPYVGLSLGYAETAVKEGPATWSQVGSINYIGTHGQNSKASGIVGGLNLGYDWRFNDLVIGAEIGGSLFNKSANGTLLSYDATTPSPADPVASSTKLKSSVVVKPKFGFILNNETEIYGTAGIAFGRVSRTVTGLPGVTGDVFLDPGVSSSSSRSMTGYTVGIGVERMVSKQLSLKLEFNYIDFGNKNFSYGGTTFGTPSSMVQDVKVTNSAATLGLNYRF